MTYTSLKKLIDNANKRYVDGSMTTDEYNQFKDNTLKKMDVLLICDRLSTEQYEELRNLFVVTA